MKLPRLGARDDAGTVVHAAVAHSIVFLVICFPGGTQRQCSVSAGLQKLTVREH
jgi:hypothetical protein